MNKQEFQQKIKDMKPPKFFNAITLGEAYKAGFEEAKGNALFESCFLDEPEKPVIPKYVADWIEWCKKHKVTLLGSITAVFNNKNIRTLDASRWATKNQETFTKAWFYGYEVEKEKLYTVEIPNPNSAGGKLVLSKQQSTGRLILEMLSSDINKPKYLHLTEAEIKEDFEWAFRWAKEVE